MHDSDDAQPQSQDASLEAPSIADTANPNHIWRKVRLVFP